MCILCSKLKVVFLNTFELSESQESKNILFPKFAIRNKKLVRIYKKKTIKKTLIFPQISKKIAQMLISCFAKMQKFRPNFDFVFLLIFYNSSKISRNKKLKISRNFPDQDLATDIKNLIRIRNPVHIEIKMRCCESGMIYFRVSDQGNSSRPNQTPPAGFLIMLKIPGLVPF